MSFTFYYMNTIIRFCYRKIIDHTADRAWEKLIWQDSFSEFKMQAQRFNPGNQHSSFGEIISHNPSAEQLHFLVSGAATGYVKQLNGKIPDVLNALGKQCLPFKNFRFEIINSDIKNSSKHTVAINFFSEPVQWMATIGEKLLIAENNETDNGILLTETLSLQPFLSIYSVQYNQ